MNATDTNAAAPIRYMVRCTGCKTVARIDVPARHESVTLSRRVLGERGWVPEVYKHNTKVEDLGACVGYLYAVIGSVLAGSRVTCWGCGRALKFARIAGKYSPTHECNAKCLASKGPQCECSCGGKNHGGSYA
jgi:hypothetical protein